MSEDLTGLENPLPLYLTYLPGKVVLVISSIKTSAAGLEASAPGEMGLSICLLAYLHGNGSGFSIAGDPKREKWKLFYDLAMEGMP